MRWLVYGARPLYTSEIAEIVRRRGETFVGAVDNVASGNNEVSHESSSTAAAWFDPDDMTSERLAFDSVVLSASPPGIRKILRDEVRALGVGACETLIDPTATVASNVALGEGVTINAHVVVGAEAVLDEFVQINRSSSVGHHARLAPFVTLGPGVTVASSVTLEQGVFVGAGVTILPRVTIGENATVGAGSVVIDDVPPFAVVVGNPARVVRTETTGYQSYTV